MSGRPAGPSGAGAPQPTTTSYKVRIPARNKKQNFHIMKFNATMRMDPQKWTQLRMVRENNRREQRAEEDMPKSGAGSEFGRLEREEARRKKYGMKARVYDPDAQPWLMRLGTKKEGKTYRGLREGGVAENATYYVFTNATDGSFEAHPVKEWYNFTPRIIHRTLNAEEAEEKFEQRSKILNYWSVMVNQKLKPGAEAEEEDLDGEGGSKGKKGKKAGSELKISDMDDWVDSGDDLDSDSDEDGEEADKKKKDKKKKKGEDDGNKRSKDSKKKNRKKTEADLEGNEDSDDGDDEGREVDYMSDESSDSEAELQETVNTKGVDQDEGLAKMLDSEESSDEEEKESNDEDDDDEDKDKDKKKEDGEEGGKKGKKNGGKGSKNSSRAPSPSPEEAANKERAAKAEKRKALVDNVLDPNASVGTPSKKARLDGPPAASAASSSAVVSGAEAAFEEEVRKYLMRKPMTTKEILKKLFKSKKTGMNNDELMSMLASVLKRINPHKNKVRGVMYLSMKAPQNQ